MSEVLPIEAQAVLTIRDVVYHQQPDEEVTAIEDDYELSLTTSEDPFPKTYVLGPDPQPLDLGWLTDCGLVHIKNRDKAKWVRYGYKGSQSFLVPPNGSARLWPANPQELELFVVGGKAKVAVTVFPK